jgi:GNAT superfamily N-acetyltransferase
MPLLKFIRDLFAERTPLAARNLGERVRDVSFRVMEEADIPVCLAFYRANEAAHFPGGYFDQYAAQLRGGEFLNLIAMRDGEPVGCGGLMYGPNGDACFCFGMVAPSHQGTGIGTALMLARLALLTPVNGWSTVWITAVPRSVAFHRRFGFLFLPAAADDKGVSHPIAFLDLRAAEVEACRAVLAQRRIAYPDVSGEIPRIQPSG